MIGKRTRERTLLSIALAVAFTQRGGPMRARRDRHPTSTK